ncbi:MAG: hypothetical protein FJZ58_01890 [Chlamydiae bacterium]|nr:hypothetical protein [Chlamydiota bacterium]
MGEENLLEDIILTILVNIVPVVILTVLVLIFYGICRGIHRGPIRRFFFATEKRLALWKWICIGMSSSLSLFFMGIVIDRWAHHHDDMAYTIDPRDEDPSYASQIETEVFVSVLPDIAKIFEGETLSPERLEHTPIAEPWGISHPYRNVYVFQGWFVIRIKNKGSKIAFGRLRLMDQKKGSYTLIDVPPLPPYMEEFANIVLEFPNLMPGLNNHPETKPEIYPKITSCWEQLVTQQYGGSL